MEKFIDSHAHYNARQYNHDRKNLLEDLRTDLKYIINIGTKTNENLQTLQLVSLYDYIYGMIGFFPCNTWMLEPELCKDAEDNWLILTKQLLNQKIVGVGEIGLDFHWDSIGEKGKEIKGKKARMIQEKWFRKQIELAKELSLPISIHSREAEVDTLRIMKDYSNITGVVHCFSYGERAADFFLNKGFYLGIGGTSTYPGNKELREVIKKAPLEQLLLETDAPYLTPQSHRRERNQSDYIKEVIELIAKLKGISENEVIRITNQNNEKLFGLQ